jgi:putative ABC transport system permease protein
MDSFLADLRYTFRELRKRPTFALTAILSLAIGIAATSAVFSVVYAVLIDPFPYPGSDRLMEPSMLDSAGKDRYAGLNGPQMQQLRQSKSIESIAGMDQWNLTTTDGDLPEDVRASYLSPDDPNHWGTPALMGRWLIPSDAPYGKDPQPIVVIGYKFWQRYYLGDPGVVGRTLQLVHKPYQIVGVMPPRFKWGNTDIYLPLHVTADPNIYFGASIKLRPGVTVAQANADIQPYLEQFAKEAPARYPEKFRSNLRSIAELYAKPLGPTLYLLLGAVASLLLIGCANVSILLLARGAERQQEFAVRSAVGAERLRIIRQLLTESLTIAFAGAILGVLLAWRSLALIIAWLPENSFPSESVIKMNWLGLVSCFVATSQQNSYKKNGANHCGSIGIEIYLIVHHDELCAVLFHAVLVGMRARTQLALNQPLIEEHSGSVLTETGSGHLHVIAEEVGRVAELCIGQGNLTRFSWLGGGGVAFAIK